MVIAIEAPEPDVADDWRCRVHVSTRRREWVTQGVGVDALQALILALGHAKVNLLSLDRVMGPLTWLGANHLGLDFEITPTTFRGDSPGGP